MGIFSRLFGKKETKEDKQDAAQGRIEQFVSLVSVYNQAFIASHFGITDIKMLPELMTYKRVMHIPTSAGKLGVGEKSHIKKFMIAEYGMEEIFFKELDSSIRRNCKGIRDVQSYFLKFGNFTNELLQHLYTEYQWQLQGSMLSKKMLRSTLASSITKLMTSDKWKSPTTAKVVMQLRASATLLGFSSDWMTEFAYQVLRQTKAKKG